MSDAQTFQCVVVGGGPAGLAAALALAQLNIETAVVAPPHRPLGDRPDTRTAALFAGSIELLRNLDVWEACAPVSEPLSAIRIVDDTGSLLKAPEVLFSAGELGLDTFGYNVPNEPLAVALRAAAINQPQLTLIESAGAARLEIGSDGAEVHLAEGALLKARLVAAADGRKSLCRAAAGISTRQWRYEQSALACVFEHARPHGGVSTEFHRPAGPFTVVPMPGLASSLVWVERPAVAERLAGLEERAFRAALETRLKGLLGGVGAIGPRVVFPLSGLTPSQFGKNRVALIGEAGHVIPPIGAQGLNLGLRDAAVLTDCVADALSEGGDVGGKTVLERYNTRRQVDVTSRIWTVDILNRSLISGALPVHLARGLGLFALKTIGPLRRLIVREGLQPSSTTPRLMQPGAPARTRPSHARTAA